MFAICLAPWLDLYNFENPTELHAASVGVSTIVLVLGLLLTGFVAGVFAIWRKLKVRSSSC
jgi:hypothetical protein